jgi:glycosyltransferase involved in cell wall biosynthesis
MESNITQATTPKATSLAIAFFVPWITRGKGGTEGVGSFVANGMADRGHRVSVYTFDDNHGPSLWQLNSSIKLRTLAENTKPESITQMLLELQVDRPDVIIGLHMNREFLRYTYAAWKLDIPIVLSEHINPEYPRKIGTFGEHERTAIFSGANRIHLLIDDFRCSLPEYLHHRIKVIHNSVRLPATMAEPGAPQSKTILTVARLVPRKRIDLLISAFACIFKTHPDWELQIAGYGADEGDLKKLARSLGVNKSVKFLGQVDNTYELYERAAIFALPSETEGFPLTVIEAMAHGLPVVGFDDCAGLNQQAVHQMTGLLAPRHDREAALVEALRQLMDSASLREELGLNGRQRFLTEYSPQKILDEWEGLIGDTAAEKGNALSQAELSPLSIANAQLLYAMQGGLENYNPIVLGD